MTDAILAHTEMPSDRPAHKLGLRPLAKDLESIQRTAPRIGRGMYKEAMQSGSAPAWVVHSLVQIEEIEQRIYNVHQFRENLVLALSRRVRIKL